MPLNVDIRRLFLFLGWPSVPIALPELESPKSDPDRTSESRPFLKQDLQALSMPRLTAKAEGKMVSTYTKFRDTQTAMENPKMRNAGIIDARLLAKEHAEVVVVTNMADPVFWKVRVSATA